MAGAVGFAVTHDWWQYLRHPAGPGRPMPAARYRSLARQQRRSLDREITTVPDFFGIDPADEAAAHVRWGSPPPSTVWAQRVQPPPPCASCWGCGVELGQPFRRTCSECGGAKYPPLVVG